MVGLWVSPLGENLDQVLLAGVRKEVCENLLWSPVDSWGSVLSGEGGRKEGTTGLKAEQFFLTWNKVPRK